MGITLAVFKIVRNIPVEKDKLYIIARCLDIWSWTRCKILVGVLLGPQALLILRDDIILQISSLFVAVIMKELLFFDDKKLLKDLFENLIFDWKVSAIDVKKLLKVYAIVIGSLIYFSSFLFIDGVSLLLCFIDTRDLIPIQVFLISLMFSLKNLMKYFPFSLLSSVDKRYL